MGPFRFSDRTLAVAIGLFAAGYLVLAFDLPDFTAVQVPVQPATLPRWLGAVLLLLAVLLFFQRRDPEAGVGADSAPTATTASPGPDARLGRIGDTRLELALFAASIAVYIALLEPVGFLISTAVYLAGATAYLGYRRHWVTGLLSVGVAAGLYFLMSDFLNVALPPGPLPF
ncbi:putative tricarboxylic transport membrane protein [Nocardiopsis mwathae]|uniref:Putative tricarboxylic transport membrane protein n=1 Tax=Nocardiopsis mwathae TaxID=1472723 RepID=A0A7W9YDK3_9ACTN|nr:tripartite tricarboxylate transporter TctB family protein [Nocardiopsis mwathae]MBB6170198.1 putative tricarboxylic transport membrane protein [Nocardiopsis mwathae]